MESEKNFYNWYLIGGSVLVVIIIIVTIILSSQKSSVPNLQNTSQVKKEKTLHELLNELFSKKGEKIDNVRTIVEELRTKYKQNIQVIERGSMVTRDHRLDRIRITVGGFGSNEILSIQRG
jgi:hypothetical protein